MTSIKIASQTDFDNFIRNYAREEELSFEFESWPRIQLKYEGENLNPSAIPAKMASAIHFLKQDIRKLYCLSKYNKEYKKLTLEEQEKLEFTFCFTQGSLIENIDLNNVLSRLTEGAISKLEGKHYVMMFGIAAGVWGWDSWVERLQKRDQNASYLEVAKTVSEGQVEILQTITSTISAEKNIAIDRAKNITKRAVDISQESQDRAIKVIGQGQKIKIGDREEITGALVLESAKKSRTTYEEVRFNLNAKVYGVDFKKKTVSFYDLDDNGTEKKAKLDINEEAKLDMIRLISGKDSQIELVISARESEDGLVKDLIIVDVENSISASN